MHSTRRATQRAAAAGVAIASVFLLATCDLDKIVGSGGDSTTTAAFDSTDFTLSGPTEVTLGGTATLTVGSSVIPAAQLAQTVKRWKSAQAATLSINDSTGVMTGLNVGTAKITVTLLAPELGDGITKSQAVRVRYKGIRIISPSATDSIQGLGQTRTITVQGLDNLNALRPGTLLLDSTRSKDTSIVKVLTATSVVAAKNGSAYFVAIYDGLKDSVLVRVRQVAKSITFPTTDYTARHLNFNLAVPHTVVDVNNGAMPSPTRRWRTVDTTVATVDSITGVLRVKRADTTRVFVKVDTVERGQKIVVAQVVASLTKFAGDAQTAQAGTLVSIPPQVTVLDSGSTPIVGQSVTFAVTAGNGVVTSATTTTDVNGRAAVGSWRLGTLAGGPQQLTATAGSASVTFSATATPGPAAFLGFVVHPASVSTNSTISPSITVRVTDTLNNTVTSSGTSITLAILNNPGAATLGGTTSRSTTNGVATFNDISLNAAGGAYSLQATAGGLVSAQSNSFDVFGAANKLGFISQPTNSVISQPISPTVKIAIQDANGLTVTNATSTVTLSVVAGPSTTLNGIIAVAAVNGVATFTGVNMPIAGSGYQIRGTASAPTLPNNTVTSNAFTVAAVGPAVKLGFSVNPGDATAGSTISPATGVRVAIQDANGATVTTASASVTLSFETNVGNGTLSGTSLTQSTSAGVAIFSGLQINKSGVGYKLRATVSTGTLTAATSNAFNINPGTFSKLRFEQQPTATQTGTVMSPGVRVALSDANDNTVTTSSASITLTTSCTVFSGGTSTATSSGVATFSAISLTNAASNCQITATGGGFTAFSSTFNVVAAGGATKIAFTSNASTVTSGAPFSIGVELLNSSNVRVTSASTQITLAIGTNSNIASLGGTVQVTTASGLATFPNLTIGPAGTGFTIVASATGYTSATSSSFNVVPSAARKVAFLTQPSAEVAGVALSPAPLVAIQDSVGNTVTSATNPIQVAFAANPPGGTLSGTTTVTPVNGIATFDNVRIAKSGSGYSLIASAPNTTLTSATSNTFDIAVGTAFGFAFKVQPTNAIAGQTISPSVQVQIVDDQGNSVTTASNQISLALTGGTGGAVLGGTTSVGPTLGLSIFSNLNVNTPGTAYRLSAAATGLTTTQSNTFDISVGTPTKLVFKTQPTVMTSGAPGTFTVAITDANNNTVSSASANITLAVFSGPGTIGGTVTQPTVSGVATFSDITLSAPGSFTLQATSSPFFSAGNSATITVASHQLVITQGNGQTGTVGTNVPTNPIVQVRDGAGTPVAGINVTFTTTGTGTLNNSSSTSVALNSDGSGNASVIWKLRTASGADTLIASLTGTPQVIARFTATANPGPASAMIKVAGDAQSAAISTAVAIAPQVKVADSFGNGINGASVTFSVTGGGGSLTGASQTTNSSGIATLGSWTLGSSVGANSLLASSGGLNTAFTATGTASDPCTAFFNHTLGTTTNATLDPATDCVVSAEPRDQYNVTTSSSTTFFSASLSSTAFQPLQWARVWSPSTSRLGYGASNNITLHYLIGPAATYGIDVQRNTPTGTGAYSLVTTINPTISSGCPATMVTRNISAVQTMSTSCTVAHDSLSSIPGRVSSVRYYYIWQAAGTPITVRMDAGTIGDPYLEAMDLNGLLITFNDDGSGLNSVMTIPAPGQGRFVEIRAMHYLASGGSPLSGDFTLSIDP